LIQAESADELHQPCVVTLGVFDGPLDLLLTLVKEQRLDIQTVPLAAVAEQYLHYIAMMDAIDVEVAAEYLVVAATLLFIKSKALLPPIPEEFLEEGEETPEQAEARLRARLVAYSQYRNAGDELKGRFEEAHGWTYREGGDVTSELVQHYRIDSARLARALEAVLSQAREEKRTVVRERVSVLMQMEAVMRRIRAQGTVLFSELCAQADRETVIVTFLAILELIRRRRIAYDQPHPFDDIVLTAFVEEVARAG